MSYEQYTRNTEEIFLLNENKLYDRHQAEYDYNGAIDTEGDAADYYRPLYAVRVGWPHEIQSVSTRSRTHTSVFRNYGRTREELR